MTVRIERTIEVQLQPAEVWEFISDPANRADAISIVKRWERDGDELIWHIGLPIPLISQTFAVRTRDIERVENEVVRFTGRSSVFDVSGEHRLEAIPEGTKLTNRFIVDGNLPGVEGFFERNFDKELDNLLEKLHQAERK